MGSRRRGLTFSEQSVSPAISIHERAIPKVAIDVVDIFSGCGGMSYGFAHANPPQVEFVIRGAVDIDAHASATYERMLGVKPLQADVRELLGPGVLGKAIVQWGIGRGRPLVLIGCAPCQGFSSHRKKDPREDERDSLVEVFGLLAARLRPDVVVMENVPELLSRRHWGHFTRWRSVMREAGYHVRARIYNMAAFGVPQERFRAVVIASRDWKYVEMPKPFLRPEEYRTVRSAIAHLPPLRAGQADPVDPMHMTSNHKASTVELISMIPKDGGSHRALPGNVGPQCFRRVDGFRDVYGRLFWDRPSVSITARCRTPSCGRFIHPEQHRGLSVREAALLQGFPETYYFEGPFDDKFKQVGNAVSPVFARALARCIADQWSSDHDSPELEADSDLDVSMPIQKSFSSQLASIKRKGLSIVGASAVPA